MFRFRLTASALALCAGITACDDVPLVPRWDADWYVPLPTQAIFLSSGFTVGIPIPPGSSANVDFPPQTQTLDESVGQILERDIRNASVILTLSKAANLQFSADDTLFIAASQADLTSAASTRIIVPVNVAAGDLTITDTSVISGPSLAMLRNVAAANGDLWIQLRGRATYQGTGNYTVQPTDSIAVRLALLARIGVSTN